MLEDRIDLAWVVDRITQGVVFVGGVSAILFVIAIFVFIAQQGLGFVRSCNKL